VIEHLTVVRGIGPWTAQMFLLFDLRRLDVWPTGDYGVRAGFAKAHSLPEPPTERAMASLGDPFTPYRSVLAWWCWREVDTVTAGNGSESGGTE
jgi:3-methyladenine DNA glycosylase/8-oxoguanine DNA glycosylase